MLFKRSVKRGLSGDFGLRFQLVTKGCFCCGDGSGGKLDDILGVNKEGAQVKWLDVHDKADDAIPVVDKNSVDGKTHKEHVDRPAFCDDKRFSGADLVTAQKALHARQECVGHNGVRGDNRISVFIKNLHVRKERYAERQSLLDGLGLAGRFLEHFLG